MRARNSLPGFARAGFAGNQDGTRRRGDLVEEPQNLLHPGGIAQKIFQKMVLEFSVIAGIPESLLVLSGEIFQGADFYRL